jgi:hypothetical protein
MPNHDIDPWDKEELSAVRHAGTLYAGAVAVIVALNKADLGSHPDSSLLKFGIGLLLVGTTGSIFYQLVTIQLRSRKMTVVRQVSAICVAIGAFGFIALAFYAMSL